VAGLAMLILNPYLLAYDVGFQLSFMATLGLILVAPYFETRLQKVPGTLGAREFLIATLATQIFVSPLLLYQIGEFSVVAVIINVLVLPMVPVAMLLTFATGMVAMVSTTMAVPLAWLAYASLSYIIILCEGFASLSFASYVVPAFPFWLVPLSYMVLGYFIWRWYHTTSADFGYGDMAERLLVVNTPVSHSEYFQSWTIEEESVVRERLQKDQKKRE
jgi:competence protein ComEC